MCLVKYLTVALSVVSPMEIKNPVHTSQALFTIPCHCTLKAATNVVIAGNSSKGLEIF